MKTIAVPPERLSEAVDDALGSHNRSHVARRLGLTRRYLSPSGLRELSTARLIEIAEALGYTVEILLTKTDETSDE